LEAGGDLSTGGKLDVSGNGAGSDGGFLVLNANGAITVGGRIAADGSGSPDFGGFGGDVSVSAGGNLQLNEQINAAGGAPDGEGVAGPVTVSGNVHAGGDLLGGQMALEACDVDLAAGAIFASSGPQSRNVIRASGQMTIDGAVSALPAGTNQLTYRDPAR